MQYDVFGIGNPLIDILIRTDDAMLDRLGLSKGSMNLVDIERQRYILDRHGSRDRVTALGGSCPNTMVMISQLGASSALCGKIGDDAFGDEYERQLLDSGVDSYLNRTSGATGSTVILVTADADRTMNTHLGACRYLSKEDVNLEAIGSSEYLYVTGYQWDTPIQKEAVTTALESAKSCGVKIALSLSDLFCIDKHKDDFRYLLEKYVDLVFCNEQEAQRMTDRETPENQIAALSEIVGHVVVTLGKNGSLVSQNGKAKKIEPFAVRTMDTTGAGDAYAAGYLYALTRNYSVAEAGRLASCCAAVVVGIEGPRFDGDFRKEVDSYMKGLYRKSTDTLAP